MKTLASSQTSESCAPTRFCPLPAPLLAAPLLAVPLLAAALAGALLLAMFVPVRPAAGRGTGCSSTITVQTAADSGAGSLRQAMLDLCPGGVIDFDLAPGSAITLAGELPITKSMTIGGPGPQLLAVSGNNASRIFSINANLAVTLTGLTLRDGYVVGSGGAIYCDGAGAGNTCSPTIEDVVFISNTATASGGAMFNWGNLYGDSSPTLRNVAFIGNRATGAGAADGGGAIFNWGKTGKSSPVLTNVLFYGNSAWHGGAMLNNAYSFNNNPPPQAPHGTSRPIVTNATFVNNRATGGPGQLGDGGAIANIWADSMTLTNAILWGNTATGSGQQIMNWKSGSNPVALIIRYSLIQGGDDGLGGDIGRNAFSTGLGNIAVNPLLADAAAGDLRLLPGSPAIDAGANMTAPGTDLRGVVRPVNLTVDMGAYESRGFTLAVSEPQTATIGSALGASLVVTASSAFGEPVGPGGVLTLSPPSSGAGITVTAPFTAATNAAGAAAKGAWANLIVGSYGVTVTARGVATPGAFVLANARSPVSVTLEEWAANRSVYGQGVTFIATVTGAVAAAGGPMGAVTFNAGAAVLGTSSLVTASMAMVTTTSLPVGSTVITATYGGDGSFAPGESNGLTHLVDKAPTTTTLAITPTAAYAGHTVWLTGTVGAVPGLEELQPSAVTGTIEFTDTSGTLNVRSSVTGAVASMSSAALPVGAYTVTASYNGSGLYLGSQSEPVTLIVSRAAATVTMATSANPALAYAPVTLTVNVRETEQEIETQTAGDGVVQVTDAAGTVNLEAPLVGDNAALVIGGLATGSYTLTAHYSGGDHLTAGDSVPLVLAVVQGPLAVNDAAGTLEESAVAVDVLGNDQDFEGNGLCVAEVTQPLHGTATVDGGGQLVTYTPEPGFSGLDSFTYMVRAGSGYMDSGRVAVVVNARHETPTPPELAYVLPSVTATLAFTTPQVSMRVELPAGFYTETLADKDIFYLAYTHVTTPAGDVNRPPGSLAFGNFVFDFSAYRNDEKLHGIRFDPPITATFTYSPALIGNLLEPTLILAYWDGTTWSRDGITVLGCDPDNHTFTVLLAHLSEFAFFAAAPTALLPVEEPAAAAHLYLPIIGP